MTSDSHPGQGSGLSCPGSQCPPSVLNAPQAQQHLGSPGTQASTCTLTLGRPQLSRPHPRPGRMHPALWAPLPHKTHKALRPLWHCWGQISTNTPVLPPLPGLGPAPPDNTMLGAAPPWAAWASGHPSVPWHLSQGDGGGQVPIEKRAVLPLKVTRSGSPWKQRPGQEGRKPSPRAPGSQGA